MALPSNPTPRRVNEFEIVSNAEHRRIYSQPVVSQTDDRPDRPKERLARTYTVKRRSVVNHQVRLHVESGESVLTRRFIPVSPGATLTEIGNGLFLNLKDGFEIQVSPVWNESVSFRVGDAVFPIEVKEIETQAELDGFTRLTKYHYRGAKGVGRTVPLVITTSRPDLPNVLGFIELATSFLVNSARKKILNAAFCDQERGVAWLRWDSASSKIWINSIARISRCVVFPEFRGLGLASVLVESAVKYARDRWHLGGMRPVFIEITADMLRYWPFVEKSGFVYVGDTEGNDHRAARDMRYLIRRATASGHGTHGMPKGGGGILSLQRSRAAHLREVVDGSGMTLEDVIDRLRTSPDRLSDEEWVLLHTAYRRPKPTYLRGLTDAAQDFLLRRTAKKEKNDNRNGEQNLNRTTEKSKSVLDVRGLTIKARSKPVSSTRSRRVQEAFGIVSTEFEAAIVENLDIALNGGEIILVTGPSGSGKSLLLDAIRGLAGDGSTLEECEEINVNGLVRGRKPTIARPAQCPPNVAPIDAMNWLSMEVTLQLMAAAGLAEPQLLIRHARTLSVGQRYRLSLAMGLAAETDILIVDEFCEPLDHFSSVAVAKNLKREVTRRGTSAIVATSRPEGIMSSLQPDRLLFLSSDGGFRWQSTNEGET